ncbi:MAG TPA: TIGR02266 family protein [Thermoanaerobaculia bacterium]|nr:TIGR02266 family protein [Thermoanaerobaculia bacterium]
MATDYSNLPRDQTRVPLAHRIQLKFDRFSGFINEYFSNISPGGIFIRTDTPEAPGQLLEFEFRLGDGYELIRGRGEVVWARERGEGPERPPGMGVRFLDLSPGSKDLIYKIVDDYVAHGGKPFDPTPPPAAGPEAGAAEPHGEMRAPGREARPVVAVPDPPALARTPPPATAPPPVTAPPPAVSAPSPPPPATAPPPAMSAPGLPPAAPPRPAAAPPQDDLSSLPWRLEIPAIQQLPGVPAITPRSPLESLGAGDEAAGAGGTAAGGLSATGEGAPAGHAADPLAQVAAALPPLDELAPDVPALPPLDEIVAGAGAPLPPAQVPAPAKVPPPAAAPTFSSFDLRAPRRPSRLPLVGALLAVALVGLGVYLLRDTVLGWIERREAAQPETVSAAPAAPAAAGAKARTAPGLAVPTAQAAATPTAAGSAAPAAPTAAAATAAGSAAPAAPAAATPTGGAPTSAAPAPTVPSAATPTVTAPAVTAPPVTPAAGRGASPPATAPPAAASAGRAVLEPVPAPGSASGRGAGAPGATARLTAVQRITWQPVADGTEVVLWGNGDFTNESYTRTRVGGLPVREVIRITGIDRPFPSPRLMVRTPELLQIRTGYHPPQELHIVLDLGSRDVQVIGVQPGPRQLRIHLRAK